MKKVIVLSPAHPLRGGIASSSERLAQELQQFGIEVIICSFSLQYPSLLFPGKTQYTDDPAPENLKIETMVNAINPLNWWRVGLWMREQQADAIIVRYWLPFMGPCLGTILRIAKRNTTTKVLALVDNIIPHEKRPGDQLFTKYFVRAIDGFIVMSKAVARDVRQFSKEKPVVYVPHPIYDNYGPLASREEAISYLGLSSETKYLLFFGFIRAYKGLDLLLKAMAEDKVRSQNFKLIVAGEFYSDEEQYLKLIKDLELTDNLILKNNYIPKEEVRYYFAAADLVVQPYKSATQSGISQLAYHFEKPMVVTNVGGLPDIVQHKKTGYVVPVEVDAIAAAISDFFTVQDQNAMLSAVQDQKRFFSWAKMVEGIKDLFKQTTDGSTYQKADRN